MPNDMKLKYVPGQIEEGEVISLEAYELEFNGVTVMVGTSKFDGKTLVYIDGDLSNARIEILEEEVK